MSQRQCRNGQHHQNLGGSGKGLVFCFARSMVAVSPRLTIGSLSMDKMEKFDFAVVER